MASLRSRLGRKLRFDDRLGISLESGRSGRLRVSAGSGPSSGRGALPGTLDLALGGSSAPAPAPAPAAQQRLESSLRWATAVVVLVFVLLAGRLVQLQVLRGEAYYQKSTSNFVREVDRPAVRGQIRDRNGQILVDNHPTYSVYATPHFVTAAALAKLRALLDLGDEAFAALKAKLDARRGTDRHKMVLVLERITRDQMALLESEKQYLPGIDVEARAHRYYPNGPVLSHVLGYLNMAGPDDLKRPEAAYRSGDYVGRAGLERMLEREMRGQPGFEKYVIDAWGRKKYDAAFEALARQAGGELQREPVPGLSAVLTIDLGLQRIVEAALSKHYSAAAAVVDVETGKVLALASHPQADPNLLTGRLSRAEAQRLESDPYRPLLDKSLRESYYPGSTFKVIPALAALEEKLIDPDEKVTCHGRYELGRHVFRCMKAHGPVTLHDALVQSCNVYFYHLAEKVGLERMARMAQQFGFGAKADVGLLETPGFVPTLDYYKKNGGFRGGYALNTALGQGAVRVSVLQLAMAYAALASGGQLRQPLLVERLEKPSGEVVKTFSPTVRNQIPVTPDSLERMRRALVDVVADTKGTANSAYASGLDVAGKSGTAQVRKNRRGEAEGWDTGNDHAWFVGFAPSRHAKIAVAVLIEHGGLGGHVAAPTAVQIFQGYFNQVAPEQRPRYAVDELPAGERLKTTLPTAGGVQ